MVEKYERQCSKIDNKLITYVVNLENIITLCGCLGDWSYTMTPPPPPLTHAPESPLDWLLTNFCTPLR